MPFRRSWSPQLPPLRDFVISAGFGGVLVLLAAVIVLLSALLASRRGALRLHKQLEQQDRHHQEDRADGRRREAIERCWERLVWLVKTAGIDPAALDADEASLGLGPELTLAILQGLQRDAKKLGDNTLTQAVAVYLSQYGLVLGQRIGSLPDVLPPSNGHPELSTDGRSGGIVSGKADGSNSATTAASTRKGHQK
ncbi:MAG: hypothetical protein WA488_19865 [Mycobacterium sp.]|uniref:hypothetical protein n=2 Tax=Mycobacterium sp. TaxID=1785 RepID=UPI003BB51AA0